MEFRTWSPDPATHDRQPPKDELLVTFDQGRAARVLVIPALFDEANKLRRFTITVMRALDEAGIDSFLPDWPGCNESLAPMAGQTLTGWRSNAARVAEDIRATHILSLRAGALIAPGDRPGWRYAPVEGAKLLSTMLRAQTLAAREAGVSETRDALLERGRDEGLTLGGWPLGPELIRELETAQPVLNASQTTIEQAELGGPGLWLRAEPDEDTEQAAALAKILIDAISAPEGPTA